MSPWMWLSWTICAGIVLFVLSATAAAVVQGIRKPGRCVCPGCGTEHDGTRPPPGS